VVLLLASDLFLPVPSSLVSAGAVAALGPALGAAAVWLGMSLGALLGYFVGKSGGRALALRVVGPEELERAAALHERFGAAVLVVCRGVPVLAEASSLFAGLVRMPFAKFAFVAGTANAGLALTYALFGDLASGALSLIAPFALGNRSAGTGDRSRDPARSEAKQRASKRSSRALNRCVRDAAARE
jgi:3-dehydroquinate synthase